MGVTLGSRVIGHRRAAGPLGPSRPSGLFMPGLRRIWQRLYRMYAVRENVEIGRDVHIGIGTIIWAPKRMVIGNNIYFGKYCTIECDGYIGNDVIMANQVGLIGRFDHDHKAVGRTIKRAPWIGDEDYTGSGRDLRVVIEGDLWIGYGAVILSGVTIRRGAIVAAGSVVSRDVDAFTVVAGAPARPIGMRFSAEEIVLHERLTGGPQEWTVPPSLRNSPRS